MEKPKVLYHGSSNKNIEEFEPRVDTGSGKVNGPRVYATDDIAAASIFLADIHATWGAGQFEDVWVIWIPEPREQFVSHDRGGCIYELPSDTFQTGTIGGFGEHEWASAVPVKPSSKRMYDSALETMLSFGVQVYFIDPPTYERVMEASDHGLSLARSLQSENQRRGMNVKEVKEM